MRVFAAYCLMAFMSTLAYSAQLSAVRVRILSKFHPVQISVSEASGAAVNISQSSRFPIEFKNAGPYTLALSDHGLQRVYPGRLLIEWEDGELLIVNELSLQDYVTSVALSELGWTAGEALRAQALLARTWAVTHTQPGQIYDFDDLTNSQVYKGLFAQTAAVDRLLQSNAARILTYKNKPVEVLYHADCADKVYSAHQIWGGTHTPYLAQVQLPFHDTQSTHWQRTLLRSKVDEIFSAYARGTQAIQYKNAVRNARLGVEVNGQWLGVDEFRLRVNRVLGWNQIRSNEFTVQDKGERLYFSGRGHGHLVGLCQKRAIALARQGWSAERILQLFYPGTELVDYHHHSESGY